MQRRRFIQRMGMGLVALKADALERIRLATRKVDGRPPSQVALDESFWLMIRQAFTIDENQINLNSGSVSPAPRAVQEAVAHAMAITNMSTCSRTETRSSTRKS